MGKATSAGRKLARSTKQERDADADAGRELWTQERSERHYVSSGGIREPSALREQVAAALCYPRRNDTAPLLDASLRASGYMPAIVVEAYPWV
jgi:hypothetical protein